MRYLVLFVLIGGCGDRPVTQNSRSLCSDKEVTCDHPDGFQVWFEPVDDCDEALQRWEDCGLTRGEVRGCREAIDRCEPLPSEGCEPGDGLGCVFPECEALWTCQRSQS